MQCVLTASIIFSFAQFLVLMTSLSFYLAGCQTLGGANDKEAEVFSQQKSVIASYIDAGDPRSAMKQLSALLATHSDDVDLHTLMGLTQMALNNRPRATHHFRKAYELAPAAHTGLNLTSALLEEGDLPEAARLLKNILADEDFQDYRYRERVFHNLGLVQQKLNQFQKAEKFYLKALEENPTFYISQIQLGKVYEALRRPTDARRTWEQAVEECRICFEPVNLLFTNYVNAGLPAKAKSLVREYLKTDQVVKGDRLKALDLMRLVERVRKN